MNALPKLGERPHVPPLCRRAAIKTHLEEAFVELLERHSRRYLDYILLDQIGGRNVPSLISPLLQEVRIPLCEGQNSCDRAILEPRSFRFGRVLDGRHRVLFREGSNSRIAKESLGVRLGVSSKGQDLREAGPD